MGTWTTETSDTARLALTGAYDSSANLTYAYGGVNGSNVAQTTNNAYSHGSNTWTSETGIPVALQEIGGAYDSSANLTYCIDGLNNSSVVTNTVNAYSHGSNTWSAESNDTNKYSLGAAYDSTANLTYAADGYVSFVVSGNTDAYAEGSNTWTSVTADSTARAEQGEAYDSSANLTYSIDGFGTGTGSAAFLQTVTAYAHGSNSWTTEATETKRINLGAAYDSGQNLTYAIDGEGTSTDLSTVKGYSHGSNTWTTETSTPSPTRDDGVSAYDSTAALTYWIDGENNSGTAEPTVTAFNNAIQTSTLTAHLSFSGSLSTTVSGNGAITLGANLSFSGVLDKQVNHDLTASLSMTGVNNAFPDTPTVGFIPIK